MNAVVCHACAWVAISAHRHDFRSCRCGDVSVDGGWDYKRRVFEEDAEWTEVLDEADALEWVELRGAL